MLRTEHRLDDLEKICQQLQSQLTKTYNEFGQEAGRQIIFLYPDATSMSPAIHTGDYV